MGLSRSRTVTIVVALATLTTNAFSLLLCYHLPDDPYHLAQNFGWYLHFANVLSVFGFIGALRQHALSIAIFANYLILDTILCSIPRFLLLALVHSLTSDFCLEPNQLTSTTTYLSPSPLISRSTFTPSTSLSNYSIQACTRIVTLAQLALLAGVIAGTILQFVGALQVREYARGLWQQERSEEERGRIMLEGSNYCEERGLPVIYEDIEAEMYENKP